MPIRSCRCSAATIWCAASRAPRPTSCPAWATTCQRHCSSASPTPSAPTPHERSPRERPTFSRLRDCDCYFVGGERGSGIGYKHARGSAHTATARSPRGLGDNTLDSWEAAAMVRLPASAFEDDARGLINTRMALRFLWVGVVVCGIGSIASMLQPFEITTAARAVLVGAQLLLGLLCVIGTRMVHAVPARVLVLAAAWASVVAATLEALSIGHGARSLDLAFFPLIVGLVAVLAGTRHALAMAMVCALIVVALAWAEADRLLPGAAALAHSPLSHPLITHGLLLLAGFTIGAIMLRL